jgi:hypothetical protein
VSIPQGSDYHESHVGDILLLNDESLHEDNAGHGGCTPSGSLALLGDARRWVVGTPHSAPIQASWKCGKTRVMVVRGELTMHVAG